MLRGLVARANGGADEAASHFARILKRSPDDREASYQLVLTLASQQDAKAQQRALELAKAMVKAHPQSPTAQAALGIAKQAAGEQAAALKTLSTIAQRTDARPEALLATVGCWSTTSSLRQRSQSPHDSASNWPHRACLSNGRRPISG